MRAWRLAFAAVFGLAVAGCAPSLPRPYVEAKAAGHRAYGAGRYGEAAKHFRKAAGKAGRIKDRDEALYLEAASYLRSDRHREARAAYEALIALSPNGPRTARAAYEIAKLEIEHGDASKGWKMIHDVAIDYPKSGLARRALLRFLRHLDDSRGPEATIAYLDRSRPWLDAHELGEIAMYEKARRLEELGRLASARDLYVACAEKYPYPYGGLFDDALYRASLLDEELGQPRKAVQRLERMLGVREVSTFHGSYQRPRFSKAQMRIAELYRDALDEPDRARRAFRELYDSYTTSLLRDDALWAEARVAVAQGDEPGACDVLELLVEELPESRYAPCAKLLCADVPSVDPSRECRRYIKRELDETR